MSNEERQQEILKLQNNKNSIEAKKMIDLCINEEACNKSILLNPQKSAF